MGVALLVDHLGIEQYVPQIIKDHLGVTSEPADMVYAWNDGWYLMTAFYPIGTYPTVLISGISGSERIFKSFYSRTFQSGGYTRIFKS